MRYFFVFCCIFAAGLHADSPAQLAVRGEATLLQAADEARLTVGVVTESQTAERALADNTTKMRAVVKAIQKLGIDKGMMQTGRFRIRPLYSRNADEPTITGYEVTNQVHMRTDKLPLVGSLIDAAQKEGANSVENLQFVLKDPQQYREKSIRQATQNAFSDASVLAEAAGLTLSRIVSLSVDEPIALPVHKLQLSTAMRAETPIEPGQVPVQASVYLVYEAVPKQIGGS